mgnify:FL=1
MGRQCTIIAIYSVGICVKTMATLKQTVNDTHKWSLSRICELCSYGEMENVMNGNALRQEFDEWITSYDENSDEEIISLAYIGEGSEYDN